LTFQPAPGSFGSTVITVLVDDGDVVSNTVIRSFTVQVKPIDTPPTIDMVPNMTISENSGPCTVNLTGISCGSTNLNEALTITAISSNPNVIPTPTVKYSTPSTSAALSLAPLTNAYGSATITVTVSNTQPTNNFTKVSFNVAVNQTALPPGVLTNIIVAPNTTVRYQIDPPANNGDKLNISLGSGAPSGVKITSRKGVSWLVWTPTMSQASSTNFIELKINDVSNSALSTNETVMVTVQDFLSLVVGSTSVQAGQSGTVPIALSSSDGVTNLSFSMPWPATALASPSLLVSAQGVANSSLTNQGGNLVLTIQMTAGQMLQGSNVIGSLRFQAQAGQPSGYVSLPINNLSALKPSSLPYNDWYPTAGQVAIVNTIAMLQATGASGSARSITVLGKPGNSYQLQYCTNFGINSVWYALPTYSQTNVSQTFPVAPSIAPIFYRVQQK
jgi:hypothetical protein